MRDYDILVIGELNVDLILSGQDVTPAFGQAEKLVDDATLATGSSSAIFACGASRLGLRVAFVGKVGDDEFGRFMLRSLQEHGVDTTHVIVDPHVKTGLTVHLSRPHDRAMLTYLGSIAAFRAKEIERQLFRRARHVHMSSFFLQSGVRHAAGDLFAAAHAAHATVSLDPGWDPAEAWNGPLRQALTQIDVFLPNEQEALNITQADNTQQAEEALASQIPVVAIKLGQAGATARRGKQKAACNGFPVTPVDTTGAGDSFNAGFLYAFLNEHDLETCLRWGCACGALATLQVGGTAGQATVTEVEALLA